MHYNMEEEEEEIFIGDVDVVDTFHIRTTTSARVSSNRIRPRESVITANVPLGDKVSLSPFLG